MDSINKVIHTVSIHEGHALPYAILCVCGWTGSKKMPQEILMEFHHHGQAEKIV